MSASWCTCNFGVASLAESVSNLTAPALKCISPCSKSTEDVEFRFLANQINLITRSMKWTTESADSSSCYSQKKTFFSAQSSSASRREVSRNKRNALEINRFTFFLPESRNWKLIWLSCSSQWHHRNGRKSKKNVKLHTSLTRSTATENFADPEDNKRAFQVLFTPEGSLSCQGS